jgi:hypothetical protein
MENNNRNPFSKQNKQRRQHQQHSQVGSNTCGDGSGGVQGMTSSLSRATHSTNDKSMNVSIDNGPTIDLLVNEFLISTASLGLFGDESRMEEEIINNMILPPTPQVILNRCVWFALGICLRFMPTFLRVPNTTGQSELLKVIGYQQQFCDKIGEYILADICDIVGLLPSGQTLQDYLMDIFIENNQQKPLLMAINKTWNDSGYIFNFLPHFRDEAKLAIQNILTKLRFEFRIAREELGCYPTIDNHFD